MQRRLERFDAKLAQSGLDALLVTGQKNIYYLTDFWGTNATVFITKNRRLFLTDSRYTLIAKQSVHGFDIIETKDPLKDIVKIIESDKLETIGFDNQVSFAYYQGLQAIFEGYTLSPQSNFLDFRMREYGASGISFESIIASGYRSAMPHGVASEKVIQSGETLTMDFGCYYNHYVSDMTRTIHIGDTTDEEREIYDIVLRSNQALIDAAKAGMTRRDYDKVARDVIVEAGYGDYFTHGIGHGIGLDIHEIPYFGNSDETIEAGMVLTDEPGVYLADKYGVRIEDDIIITENGCELITLAPKELIVL